MIHDHYIIERCQRVQDLDVFYIYKYITCKQLCLHYNNQYSLLTSTYMQPGEFSMPVPNQSYPVEHLTLACFW